jgi:hypothetical protein
MPTNHEVLLVCVLLHNWLQAKKSADVATSVKVANLVPDSLEVNRSYSRSIPKEWLSLDRSVEPDTALLRQATIQAVHVTFPSLFAFN